ncbi:MAG: hypothetical protein EPO30_06490 [Lysobacteraceae bacterium]|nr:MAG: hypothetical protein EPO30_06490 [Xanthomonadaceae bacterium]
MATATTGPWWADHTQEATTFSVRHLHPTFTDYCIPAIAATKSKPGREAIKVKLRISYSHHCFTRDLEGTPGADPDHYYNCSKRPKEKRVFCPHRWNESHALPGILSGLNKCYFAPKTKKNKEENFFIWRNPSNPALGEYFVFFKLKLHKNGFIDLVVQSAYPRTDGERLKNSGPTTLQTLIANMVGGKKTFNPNR